MDENVIRYGSVCSGVEAASLAWKDLGWKCVFVSQVQPFPCAVLQQRLNATPPIYPLDPNEQGLDKAEKKLRKAWLNQIKLLPKTGDLPNEGDFTKIGGKYEGKIDLLVGGTPCFASGAMVLTPNGYVPIETLQIGDTVVSHNGNICKVIDVGFKLAETGLAHVVGRDPIRCTGNHPFYSASVKRDYRRKSTTYGQYIVNGDFEFIPIENSVNRYVGRISINTAKDFVDNFIVSNLTRELTLLIAGYYVGDGYIRHYKEKNKKQVIIALVNKKKIEKFNEFFNEKINYSVGKDGKIIISNTALADWLIANFGEHSLQKHIPLWLYNDKDKIFFLEGYKNTDGHQINDNSYKITTVSSALAYGVADLQGSSTVHIQKVLPTKKIDDRIINQHDYYNVVTNKNSDKTKFFNDRYASKIKGWENDGIITKVYNITVERDNSYIVNGLSVHNCQSFSIAGKREGLAGVSGLALDFIRLAYESRAKWVIWENVPGALSSNNGHDFAAFLSGLTGSGIITPEEGWGNSGFIPNGRKDRYGVAWRILDAQYTRTPNFPYAVPQRRRRIFLVGYFGDWRRAVQVLFEPQSLRGYPEPVRKTRKEIARDIGNCVNSSSRDCERLGKECVHLVSSNGIVDNRTNYTILKNNETKNYGVSFDINYECPILEETGHALKNGTAPGTSSGVVNCENKQEKIYCIDHGAGKSSCSISINISPTLATFHDGAPIINEQKCYNITTCDANGLRKDRPNGGLYVFETNISKTISTGVSNETVIIENPIEIYALDSKNSNSMKSSNPFSGCHKTQVAKTIDTTIPEPSKGQGGIAIIKNAVDKNKDGYLVIGIGRDAFNQGKNAKYGISVLKNVQPTLTAQGPGAVCLKNKFTIPQQEIDITQNVIALDGDKIGKNERKGGSGLGVNEDGVSYTLTAKDVHAVAYENNNVNDYKFYWYHSQNVDVIEIKNKVSPTMAAGMGMDGPNTTTPLLIAGNVDNNNNDISVKTFQKVARAYGKDGLGERWEERNCAATQNVFDNGDIRAVDLVINNNLENEKIDETISIINKEQDIFNQKNYSCALIDLRQMGGSETTVSPTLTSSDYKDGKALMEQNTKKTTTVRRLMPLECERLMGFPDNWTYISWRGQPIEDCPDAPRYKSCGNSMCVNCMEWVGRRITLIEREIKKDEKEKNKKEQIYIPR